MKRLLWMATFYALGCSTLPPSDAQITRIQTRIFPKATKEAIFDHFKSSLNRQRYSIKNAELMDGTLVASRKLPEEGGASERHEEIIINVNPSTHGVNTRVSIQVITHYSLGGTYGAEVVSPKYYERFYAQMLKNRDTTRIPSPRTLGK